MPGRRRESFDEVADAYNTYRPSPPVQVVDAVVTGASLRTGSRVLEIGCGAGQLSVPLAERGVELTAVELGPHLAALARENLARFPNVCVEVGAFEAWPLPAQKFDAVVCANAFHWLDPEIRLSKSAQALCPDGSLVLLHVHHARGGTPGFFEDTQPYYMDWGLSEDPFFQPPTPAEVPTMYEELDEDHEFRAVERRRFEIPMRYSTTSYVGWLRTDSLVNSLDAQSGRGFLADIEHLIDTKYDGEVVRNFVYEVVFARRSSC
jgi:SAM-dependent methyltransferase